MTEIETTAVVAESSVKLPIRAAVKKVRELVIELVCVCVRVVCAHARAPRSLHGRVTVRGRWTTLQGLAWCVVGC